MERNKIFKGKKLLVLAGNFFHSKIVKAAQEMGAYVIVTDYLPLEESPAKLVADEYWMLSTGDIDAVVERCQQEHVDGVLAYCIDTVQHHYYEICQRLGVPCYGTKEQFDIMTNKRLFKDFCSRHGVDVVPEYTLEDVENDRVTYPVLVKPSDSRGSRGQTVCFKKQKIQTAVSFASAESKDGKHLIERYMQGAHDMACTYIVINKTPILVKICDRYLGKKEDNLDRQQISSVCPSIHADEYVKNVEPHVKDMIRALGLDFGVVFLQGFLENGRIYMYDPGLRFPGSDFDIVLKEAIGFDCPSTFVHYALTGDITSQIGNPINAYQYQGGACVILSIPVRAGIINKIEGMDALKNHEGFYTATLWHHEGDVIEATGDVRQRAAETCFFVPDRKLIPTYVKYIYNTLKITDKDGQDMLISKVEPDKMY